jgi:hypothetical protein
VGSDNTQVRPDDTQLLPVPAAPGHPTIGAIVGYEMNGPCPFSDPSQCQLPLYQPYNRDTPGWWDNVVEELEFSRVNVAMVHGRGCLSLDGGTDGNGNMCPRELSNLVDAIDRAGLRGVMKLGMWDDTGAYPGARDIVRGLPAGTPFDLSNHADAEEFFWDRNMKIWFDTIPKDLWYTVDGHPIVAFWSLSGAFFSNQQGNASWLLDRLKQDFEAHYGVEPYFMVDKSWIDTDSTLTPKEVWGVNNWFDPSKNNYTMVTWNGKNWEASVPGFRDPGNDPGCGAPCREFSRNHGLSLDQALHAGEAQGATFDLLEGFTDVAESAGSYRSQAWDYPNQYLDIIRNHADPGTETVRFEAEAADASSFQVENSRQTYRSDMNVDPLPDGNGWAVDDTSAGDWIEFKQVYLDGGEYRFTARAACTDPEQIHLRVDGVDFAPVTVMPNNGDYSLVHLGTADIQSGNHDISVVFDSGNTSLDWAFSKKVDDADSPIESWFEGWFPGMDRN